MLEQLCWLFRNNYSVSVSNPTDLFNDKGGKLVICTHKYSGLDPLYFFEFMKSNVSYNTNTIWKFVAADNSNDHLMLPLFTKLYPKLFNTIISKITITTDRSKHIRETLHENNNVVMFVNGHKLSSKLFTIIQEMNKKDIYMVDITSTIISDIDWGDPNVKRKLMQSFFKQINHPMNITVKKVPIDPTDIEQYKKVSNDFFGVKDGYRTCD